MAPALAERIESSVRGGRRTRDAQGRPVKVGTWKQRGIALGRVAMTVALVAALVTVVDRRWRAKHDFEQARASLLGTAEAATASLTRVDVGTEGRIESWLLRAAGSYDGDVISDRVRAPGALAALLSSESSAHAAVYLRGTMSQVSTPAGIVEAAAASVEDPFLACLLDPPPTRAEKALLAKVHATYAGDAAVRARAANVRRLRDVQLGLPFLLPSWSEKVSRASTREELSSLGRAFERAPIEAAKRGLQSELLIFAIDEPGDTARPAELDGERAHDVRLGVVDLTTDTVLLRLRRRVDPSAISMDKRPLYAGGIDACGLAFDVRTSVL